MRSYGKLMSNSTITTKLSKIYFSIIFFATFITIIYSIFRVVNKYNFYILIFINLTSLFYLILKNNEKRIIYFCSHLSVIISIFFLNFFCEIFFTSYKLQENPFNRAEYYISKGWEWDNRNKKNFIDDLKKELKNENIFTNSNYRYVIPHDGNNDYIDFAGENFTFALSNVSNSLIVQCKEHGTWEYWKSDKYGFNNPENIYKFKNEYIIVLGDSFVEGSCVKRGKDFSNQLRNYNYNVLNLGRAAGGVIYSNAIYREYKGYIKGKIPDYVFLMLYGANDLDDTLRETNVPIIKNYYYDQKFNKNLINKQKKIDKYWKNFLNNVYNDQNYGKLKEKENKRIAEKFKRQENSKKLLVRVIKLNFLRTNLIIIIERSTEEKKKLELLKNSLQKLRNEVEKSSKFVVVYLPNHQELFSNDTRIYSRIKKVFKDISLDYIDGYEKFKKTNFKNFYNLELPGHYNEAGYNYLAKIVHEYLENNKN